MKFKKNPVAYLWRAVAASVAFAVLVLMVCIMPAGQNGVPNYSVTLTLDNTISTEATFSGKFIRAFLTFHDSVSFDDVAWHLGAGKFKYPAIAPGKKLKDVGVNIYWDALPAIKDTVRKCFYDSIYISIGGEQNRSNPARVNVTNLSPVIDTVKINATAYKVSDTLVYSVKATDTAGIFLIRVTAHDVDTKVLSASWWPSALPRLTQATDGTLNAYYQVPLFNCTDTIGVVVSDGKGGDDKRVMIIATIRNANRVPVIDSISAKDTLFAGGAEAYYYSSVKIDSIRFKVSAHDSDRGDRMSYQWVNKNLNQAVVRSTGSAAVIVWACTSAAYRDSSRGMTIVDTVVVTVFDNDSALAAKTIVIVRGVVGPNKPPVFDSCAVKDTLVKGVWSVITCKATVRDTIMFRMYAHDPDSLDTIRFRVTAQDTQRLQKQGDTAAVYVCKDTLYRDTVLLHLYDVHLGAVDKKVVIDVSNRYPLIDSVQVGDTTAKASDSAFVKVATVKDTLLVRVFARDPDRGDAVASVRFTAGTAGDSSRFKRTALTQALYMCKDSLFQDTCFIQVFDKMKACARGKAVINIANHTPVVDSLRFGDTLFSSTDAAFSRAFSVRDTIALSLFAHDPDAGDSLAVRWLLHGVASDTLRLKNVSDTAVRYFCKDSVYKDTCFVRVTDKRRKTVQKKLLISISNRYPIIDSVRCGDTLFKSRDSLYVRKGTGGDTLGIKIFARDLDIGDILADTVVWAVSGASVSKLANMRFMYVCPNSTFSDTLTVAVRDLKFKVTMKKIKIEITKK